MAQRIHVLAYESIANMLWEDMYANVPESRNWPFIGKDGKPVPGAGDRPCTFADNREYYTRATSLAPLAVVLDDRSADLARESVRCAFLTGAQLPASWLFRHFGVSISVGPDEDDGFIDEEEWQDASEASTDGQRYFRQLLLGMVQGVHQDVRFAADHVLGQIRSCLNLRGIALTWGKEVFTERRREIVLRIDGGPHARVAVQ